MRFVLFARQSLFYLLPSPANTWEVLCPAKGAHVLHENKILPRENNGKGGRFQTLHTHQGNVPVASKNY